MLTFDAPVLARVLQRAEQTMPAAWAADLETAAYRMTRNRRRISQLPGGALQLDYQRLGPYVATPEVCSCKKFRRCRMCEHRLMAWLHLRYCKALNAQPIGGAAD